MGLPLLQIPGNIKQQFTPFVINPWATLHAPVVSSTELKSGAAPQFFSYRQTDADYKSGKALLQFYPSSMNNQVIFNDDISYKLLYARKNNAPTKDSITLQDVLNVIPGISIREFLPDTRLDQCINMFTDLISNMAKMFVKDNDSGAPKKSEDSFAKKLLAASWYTMKYMVGATDPNFFSDLQSNIVDSLPFANYSSDVITNLSSGKSQGFYVMTFPYTLYYRLQSCVTTNVYEVPAITDDKRIFSSNGSAGWTGGGDILSEGGIRFSKLLNKIPYIGSLANMVLGNIGINYMPWWNADAGSKAKEPEITIKFDLFNDSAEAALNNFIFVNTIIPNNRWIQYNMFQHSSSLYDVKIEGVNRLFACAGDFDVTYEGILRDPPESWLWTLAYCHLSPNMESSTFLENAISNRIIKIPDVYRVQMKFQSLLPANFNNFIFAYAQNINHMSKYSDSIYDESTFSDALPKAIGTYARRVANVWQAGDASVEDMNAKKATETSAQQASDIPEEGEQD